MAKKEIDEELAQQLAEIEDNIASESKLLVKRVAAWRYFIHWASSYKNGIEPGKGEADVNLSKQQGSEFAFSYNPKIYPETLILFAQPSLYECLKYIGLKCITIYEDGIVLTISDMEVYDFYIAGMSIKIPSSIALSSKLAQARKYCNQVHIACIDSEYNPSSDKLIWNISELSQATYPIVKDSTEAKLLN